MKERLKWRGWNKTQRCCNISMATSFHPHTVKYTYVFTCVMFAVSCKIKWMSYPAFNKESKILLVIDKAVAD